MCICTLCSCYLRLYAIGLVVETWNQHLLLFCFAWDAMAVFSFVVIGIVVVKEIQFCVKNSILRLLNYKTKLYWFTLLHLMGGLGVFSVKDSLVYKEMRWKEGERRILQKIKIIRQIIVGYLVELVMERAEVMYVNII